MKAFTVFYNTPGSSGHSEIVLSETEKGVEEALSHKIDDYRIGNPLSTIRHSKEISLSTVKISDLSVTEFLSLTQN